MKKVIALLNGIVGAVLLTAAQSWNPYINQGIIGKAPLKPMEFGGEGVVSFNIGNTGGSALEYDRVQAANNLRVEIQLSEGVPSKGNPMAALRGTWVSYFEWSYDAASRKLTGVQKRTIPGNSQGTISLDYSVGKNTAINVAGNGFMVRLVPPAYIKGANNTEDDAVSSYTFVRALDYGDAPASYGLAKHEINLIRDNESGLYTRYIMLGKTVDPEDDALSSAMANGDDAGPNSDEDGVSLPALYNGTTVEIPVTVTAVDDSYGFLNAWFDWNGDGDFTDAGERATASPVAVYASGTYKLKVQVPVDAVTGKPTFARFRVGANGGPASGNAWGEAEDYRVSIQKNSIRLTTKQENVKRFGESSGAIDLTVNGGKAPYAISWSNGLTTEDLTGLAAGQYTVEVTDADHTKEMAVVMITQPDAAVKPNEVLLTSARAGMDIRLQWQMPVEANTEYFVLERSTDGGGFVPVGNNVRAAGNSGQRTQYGFVDRKVTNEAAIYRVKLVEKNGNVVYSNLVTERYELFTINSIMVYPNPVTDNYLVTIDAGGSYQLDVINSNGANVYRGNLEVEGGGKATVRMSRGNLAPGTYYLRATNKSTRAFQTVKIIMMQK